MFMTEDKNPYFFLITDKYVMGTPTAIVSKSYRTIDIPFYNIATSGELQRELSLLSAKMIRPTDFYEDAISITAGFLSAFEEDKIKREKIKNYLKKNGLVRILVTDDKLREEIKDTLGEETKKTA